MDSGLPPEVWLRFCKAASTRVFTVSVGVIAGAAVAVAHSSRAAVRVISTRRMRSPRFGMPRITLLDRTGSADGYSHHTVLSLSRPAGDNSARESGACDAGLRGGGGGRRPGRHLGPSGGGGAGPARLSRAHPGRGRPARAARAALAPLEA